MRLRNLITSMTNAVVTWATAWTHIFQNVTVLGTFTVTGAQGSAQAASITGSGQTVTPANNASIVNVNITTNDAWALAVPSWTPAVGQRFVVVMKNTSGGASGTITPASAYVVASSAATPPGNGTWRTLEFVYDGTQWVQVLAAADLS